MTRFVNSYSNGGSSLDIVEDINPDDIILVGHRGTQGVLKQVTEAGDIAWSKSYTIGDRPIHFIEALSMDSLDQGTQFLVDLLKAFVETFIETLDSAEQIEELRGKVDELLKTLTGGDKTGDILLLGRFIGSQRKGLDHLIMRVSNTGTPLWAKRIPAEQCPTNLSLIKTSKSFAFAGWHNGISGDDKTQIYQITGNGSVINSAMIDHGGDDEIKQMVALGGNILVVGGTNANESRTGFVTTLDEALNVQDSYLFKVGSLRSKDTVHSFKFVGGISQGESAPIVEISSYCIGTTALKTKTKTETFIAKLSSLDDEDSIEKTVKFQASEKHDDIISVCCTADHLFILGQARSRTHPPYLLKFTADLNLVWRKTLELDKGFILNKLAIKNESELWIAGSLPENAAGLVASILIKTDFDLKTCKSRDLPGLVVKSVEASIVKHDTSSESIEVEIIEQESQNKDIIVEKNAICPSEDVNQPPFEARDGLWVQSPYLYLHAAGSPGHDASEGFLLRWFLLRNLGETHLPKGNLAGSAVGFNKPDDYVTLYRAKYEKKYQRTLDFESSSPVVIDQAQKRWVYDIEDQLYYLNFLDTDKYSAAEAAYDPDAQPYEFIRTYGDGLLELEIRSNLAFSVEAELDGSASKRLQIETFSVQGDLPMEELGLSARKSFNNGQSIRVVGENIRKILWRTTDAATHILRFEFYNDFFKANMQSGWERLDRYALTFDTNEAALRLEDTAKFNVHGHWKKFRDDAYVNTQNYLDRWSDPAEGLQAGIQTYITLSDTDPKAVQTHVEEVDFDPEVVNPIMDVSYLDLLQLASTDYHVARMLGLGAVDTPPDQRENTYVYLAEYTTLAALDDGAPVTERQHIYLSLPTKLTDERLPHGVDTLPVTYGLELYPGTPEAIMLTDDNGYLPFEPVRYVNVTVKSSDQFQDRLGFFVPANEYSAADFTRPVFAGVSYKKNDASDWVKPEISHLKPFLDASANPVFEALPISFREDSNEPLYRHAEVESGIHAYRGYGINFYSRASDLGNTVETNLTEFIKPNSLLPPHNVQVQLIQPEDTLILTAQTEQDMLAKVSQPDTTLVRVLFNYTHLHDINYQYGDQVDIFFRKALPQNVVGAVSLVEDDPDSPVAIISTKNFRNLSNGTDDVPNILPGNLTNFEGGTLVIDGVRYAIESVLQTSANGDNPTFIIRKNIDRNTLNPGSGQMVMAQSFLSTDVSVEDRFIAIENMANEENWRSGIPLGLSVSLGEADWTAQTDSYVDAEGAFISHEIGGIWDTAMVSKLTDDDVDNPQIIPEYFVVEFDTKVLDHHPQYRDFNVDPDQDSVDWYKGIIRVDVENNQTGDIPLKTLDIVRIENVGSTSTLRIVAHDTKFGLGEDIKLGIQIKVNCFPGYRVYLRKKTAHDFTKDSILPEFGEGSRKTLLGLASRDTQTQDSQGKDYRSSIGIPQILYALEIVDPVAPSRPKGPKFATPPDFYGKSTYTFETLFRPETFAAVYYRADTRAILKALYKPETYDALNLTLRAVEDDEYYTDRVQHILSFNYPDGVFSSFPNDPEGFGFPNPDNTQNDFDENGTDNPSTIVDKIKAAVFASFLPLTEHPLLYSEIKDGDYTPSPKKQVVRSRDGKALQPGDEAYDNAPMAKRLSGTNQVRFTDFTLDGEMSKNTSYCYMAREMSNRSALSEPSEVLGPIRLVNKIAPETPIIRKITSRLADSFTGDQAAVDFQINKYPASANIKMLHIYRALNAVDALTPRTMDTAKIIDVDLVDIDEGIMTISDDFSDLDFLPFGDLLYYRIVALREVKYQNVDGINITELVPSKPSKTLLSNIVDVYNPDPPKLDWIGTEVPLPSDNSIIEKINSLTLSWTKTTYKGAYTLQRLNQAGNWQTIYEVSSNDEVDLHFTLSEPLKKYDEEDELQLYHRFKVTVQNPSGLLNEIENILTI